MNLFEVGGRYLRDPGVVVRVVAHAFLKSTNALLDRSDLALSKSRKRLEARLNRPCLLGCPRFGGRIKRRKISATVSDADVILDQMGGDPLAMHQRDSNIALSGHYVPNTEHAIAAGVPWQIVARETVVFPLHGHTRKDLRYRPDGGDDQGSSQFLLRARDRLRCAPIYPGFHNFQSRQPFIVLNKATSQPAIL